MNRGLAITLVVVSGILLILLIIVGWSVSVYNKIVVADETVRSGWGQVENQYQRRYDLIPNVMESVKGFAKQEREVLENVTAARAGVGQLKVTPEVLRDPEAFARFQKAQDGLSSALSRLLVVTENYPNLKSNETFQSLIVELEGTENRISVERRRFNETVQEYNILIRKFPGSMVAGFGGFKELQYFKSAEGAEKVPQVKF